MPQSNTPVRLSITDIDDNETIFAQFNPQELERQVRVNYAKKAVLGASGQPHEYLQTDNTAIRFSLFFYADTTAGIEELKKGINFLESLCYAKEAPQSIAQGAPPQVLLVWPRTLALVVRIINLNFQHQRWNLVGDTTQCTVEVNSEVIAVNRITKSPVRQSGANRAPAGVVDRARGGSNATRG